MSEFLILSLMLLVVFVGGVVCFAVGYWHGRTHDQREQNKKDGFWEFTRITRLSSPTKQSKWLKARF